ncbi:MAG: hypothetical protein A2W91_19880 [Bacteroidetes bacterium GWF2_38_335]|nr:MAG: hypothetical protein A2W91_19880 [Bacteroidetes bacterium GWF2_38_335]OFY82018.1 MAG: hypothetical protein A2281_10040 [Bacteroidetes bacterium RIFOXYA12_FULL_38_20]HBS86479.1 hypothetical protein [Bacteroidales bacterium]
MKRFFLKKLSKIFVVILSILGITIACTNCKYGTDQVGHVFRGTVTDSVTSEPIKDINVVMSLTDGWRDSVQTDASGQYVIEFWDLAGTYTVNFTANDVDDTLNGKYFSKSIQVNANSSGHDNDEQVNFNGNDIKLRKNE